MRQNFEEGMEILHQDLNDLQGRMEISFIDRLVHEIIGRKTNGFFRDSFKCSIFSNNKLLIKRGLGFQSIIHASAFPKNIPVFSNADIEFDINLPAVGTRTDKIFVKHNLADTHTELRRYKEEFEDTIYTQLFTTIKEWLNEVEQVEQGQPDPDGYLLIAEVELSPAGIVSVSDKRFILPSVFHSNSGGSKYDAVIGSGPDCTHPDINSVMEDEFSDLIKNILISESINITESQIVDKDNVSIEFKSGASIIGNGIVNGIEILGNGCSVIGGRFSDLASGIKINVAKKNNLISQCRFVDCLTDIEDNGDNNTLSSNINEV